MKTLITLLVVAQTAALIAAETASITEGPEARGARFDLMDKKGAGKLSREQYVATQSQLGLARTNFDKWDANRDSFLTRDEYITKGGRASGASAPGKSGGKTAALATAPEAGTPKAAKPDDPDTRREKFGKIDKNGTGKLSRDEFIATQKNPESAATNFDRWDADKDGVLTREEYATKGGKLPPTAAAPAAPAAPTAAAPAPAPAPAAAPAAAPAIAAPSASKGDRGAMFDRADKQGTGKLSRQQYIDRQTPERKEGAPERFDKMDTDKDGFLSRDEFIAGGKKPKAE